MAASIILPQPLWLFLAYLKETAYKHRQELKDAIEEIDRIPLYMLVRVQESFQEHLQMYIAHRGHLLSDIILKH